MADEPEPTPRKKLYIETVGCQMNMLDSELVAARLRDDGYELTDDLNQADAILYNTCSVRQHAEDKVYSALGRIKRLKERKPDVVIGVLGCMAQKDQESIFRRAPHVDIVVGPGQLAKVGEMLASSALDRSPQLAVSRARTAGSLEVIAASFEDYDADREPALRPSPYQAFIRVMMGCDKFCTYCIVPSVRGPEQSRRPPRSCRKPACWPTRGSRRSHCSVKRSTATTFGSPTAAFAGSPTCWRVCTTSPGSSASSSSRIFPTT